ncbi:MAG: response regulator [Trichlorobacter sp.]|uniref:response regulator n=1 Tax=Trichlorobacter sp. TaxID=2911007 RepID=UPI00256301CC|nr:response regulator [Trichlorobacter sp.]MDK9719410.1 response regulator [Trichlorobacter sp.]
MAKIMIIDDSLVARMSLKACIPKDAGHEIKEGNDGSVAIELYTTFQPDLTFMDLTMPGLDGMAALTEIRKYDPTARVIILTADIQTRTIERVMELGAFGLLKKPPVKDAVQAELNKALTTEKQ